jgi:hypothetical protein
MKLCPKCNQLKPLGSFYKNKSKSSGYNSHCKECSKLRDRSGNVIYQNKKDKLHRKTLVDRYIITQLKNRGFTKSQINIELIQIQRLLITLKRNIHELQRNNRPISGCQ